MNPLKAITHQKWHALCGTGKSDRLLQLELSTTERDRRVVYVSIKCLKYLAFEMVAIRGHGAFVP